MTASGWPAWDKKGLLVKRSAAEQRKCDEARDKQALNRARAMILVTPAHDNFIAKLREGKTQRRVPRPSIPEQKETTKKRKKEKAEAKRKEKQEDKEYKETQKRAKKQVQQEAQGKRKLKNPKKPRASRATSDATILETQRLLALNTPVDPMS
jgi:hypothetical protein